MNFPWMVRGVLATLVFGIPLAAQVASTPSGPTLAPIFRQQTLTTGMAGLTTNQTARLNVLNLNPVPATNATPSAAACTVELQFFDDKNNLVKQSVVPNFAPGAAAFIDLTRASVTSETAARAEIRGVMTVNPAPTPVGSPAQVGFCTVFTTLEVFDSTTGSTVYLTSDTRPMGTLQAVFTSAKPLLK